MIFVLPQESLRRMLQKIPTEGQSGLPKIPAEGQKTFCG
jgi:hypothetical protein